MLNHGVTLALPKHVHLPYFRRISLITKIAATDYYVPLSNCTVHIYSYTLINKF